MPERLPEKLRLAWEKQKQYYGCLEDFLDETIGDYLRRHDRRLVPRDLALFLRRYVIEQSTP